VEPSVKSAPGAKLQALAPDTISTSQHNKDTDEAEDDLDELVC
jgi:hypothetical protein